MDHYNQIWPCLSRGCYDYPHQVQRRSLSCVMSRFKVFSCMTQPLAESSSKSWSTSRHILEFWDRFIYPIKRIEFEPEYRYRLAFESMTKLNPWAPSRTSMPYSKGSKLHLKITTRVERKFWSFSAGQLWWVRVGLIRLPPAPRLVAKHTPNVHHSKLNLSEATFPL